MEVRDLCKSKMGLYDKIGEEIAVQDPKVKNSGWWHHLELLLHFDVLEETYFYNIFIMN
jgi:hypothetical protein